MSYASSMLSFSMHVDSVLNIFDDILRKIDPILKLISYSWNHTDAVFDIVSIPTPEFFSSSTELLHPALEALPPGLLLFVQSVDRGGWLGVQWA
jgi:hypothetical protein